MGRHRRIDRSSASTPVAPGAQIALTALAALAALAGVGGSAVAQPGQTAPGPVAPGPTAPPADGSMAPAGYDETYDEPYQGAPAPQAAPASPPQPPPGSTQATFVSATADGWDVLLDREPVCATPCSLWVEPLRFVSLRTHERAPVRLDVGYLPAGSVMVSARPLRQGAYAAGITFTALSGMGLVTGITLTAVGCASDRDTMCTAGLITGVVSGLGLYASIRLMTSALPKATLGPLGPGGPVQPYVGGSSAGLTGTF